MTISTAPPAPPRHRRLLGSAGSDGKLGTTLVGLLGEGLVSMAAALLMLGLSVNVELNPMTRVGAVSGLAGLQFYYLLLIGAVLLVAIPLMRRWRALPVRMVSAALAGLATGLTAAGIALALRGSDWPLNGSSGDAGSLQAWATAIVDGRPLDPAYPPLFPHLMALVSQTVTDGRMGLALKVLELVFIAGMGPVAYLCWRTVLPPLWALGIGVTSALPMMQPYKPYTNIVLVALVPLLAKLFQLLQRSALLPRRTAALAGGALGVTTGLLFLLYSGWFVWSALGVCLLVPAVLFRTWRGHGVRALVTSLVTLGTTLVGFLLVAGAYLYQLLTAAGTAVDRYCYFDTYTEPTYFVMWRDDLPGSDAMSTWPLPGELGGVGLFSLLLLLGLGVALAVGARNAVVWVAGACAASAMLMRYWFASHMERDQAVMLYPRTSAQMLYCLLVLTGVAAYLLAERYRARRAGLREEDAPAHAGQWLVGRRFVLAAVCALGLLYGMAGSSTAAKYMPEDPDRGSAGQLAWHSHSQQNDNGKCSPYAPNGKCAPSAWDLHAPIEKPVDTGKLGCWTTNPYPLRPWMALVK
ncbi:MULTISPECIES: hypothetical protein [Kitasatospora]|uniref:hypothetical protein n=1 Tax=Kitasatospora TaxID=2063 RepID=UPI000B064FE9|nr:MULTISPECIES: hypothetical protein [Kitasatospora]